MATMNPVTLYHDPSLDGLINQNKVRTRNNGTSRRSSTGQDRRAVSDSADAIEPPPILPEVPRGPPISYRGGGLGDASMHRSFSQRAKGRPYHREAFADMDEDYPGGNASPEQQATADISPVSVPMAIPRKPAPPDGLRLNTTNLNGSAPIGASRRETKSAREPNSDQTKFVHKARRTSDTPQHPREPVSAISRSSALRDDAQRRDWAPDRSPLQKLEVTLNDISKEEKRARVQEAEMLLRERDARKARGIDESPRERAPLPKAVASRRRPVPNLEHVPEPEARTLEDAGLVRNLSTTQRQRLQHSTTVDSHRPDVRTLSGEGQPGFDYTMSSPLQSGRDSLPHRSSGKYQSEDSPGQGRAGSLGLEGTDSIRSKPGRAQSGKQREVSPTDEQISPSDALSNRMVSHPSNSQPTRAPGRRELADRQRNASHKAALEKLTGVSAPVSASREGSRKLQKSSPASVPRDAVSSRTIPSRIPVPNPAANLRSGRSEGFDRNLAAPTLETPPSPRRPSTPPFPQSLPEKAADAPPLSLGLQSSPHPSSPQSPPEKVADATRQRQRKSSVSFKEPIRPRPADEWKEAGTARLTLADLSTDATVPSERGKAWWEQTATSSGRRRSRSARLSDQAGPDASIDDKTAEFKPRLYLRCGPLLRYTGMKRIKAERAEDREVWRGSVLIVTQDSHSSYETAPILRLFAQPQKLLPPPPHHVTGDELNPEYVDPIAGLTKLSRTGRALYVRPIDHLEEGKDLSQVENEEGLFEQSPSPTDHSGTQNVTTPKKRTLDTDGERLGRYTEVGGARLYADPDRDVTFWRFNLEIELGDEQQHIAYRINRGPSVGFWVPARGQTMNIMFHSCNGFSLAVNPDNFNGPDPLWRDVLNTHQTRPFHVMIGGGDQIYNDRVMLETRHFGEWTRLRNPAHKHNAPFTTEMKEELESFYLNRYAMWFSQGLFGMAASQIPMVNVWDDHDIIDGFGSYPHHFMETAVFSGIGNVAFKYYMLFQHQSVPEETTAHEPSWLLGREPGPYIKQLSRSVFMHMGRHVAFLGLDCRTERMRGEVLSVDTIERILERCRKELIEGETKHLVVLLGVPIAYPRLVWLENMLTSRLMDPVKALGRVGVLKGGFLNKFDGGVEILDDLDDHWTATNHKHERNDLVKDLQDLAAEKSCRITILSGDVHLGAMGQFHSNPKLKIPKDRDHRYMPNIISSAIVNAPPSDMLADILNKRNKTHHLDRYTDENMIPMFTHDVDNKKRNNKHMLPRRNWCSIREYIPGSTPPPSPPESAVVSDAEEEEQESPEPRRRRFSLTKADANPRNLFRRLSSRNAPPSSYRDMMYEQGRSASHDGTSQPTGPSYTGERNASGSRQSSMDFQATPNRRASSFDHTSSGAPVRPGVFKRRPTNLSEKAARKGNVLAVDADGNEFDVNDQVNLEGGLDVVLNVEVNQKDPSGITMPYRLLIPALWYDGSSDREKLEEATGVQRRPSLLGRFGIGGRKGQKVARDQGGNWGQAQSEEESYSEGEDAQYAPPPRRRFSLFGSRRQRREEYASDDESDHEGQPQEAARASQPQPWQPPGSTTRPWPATQPDQATSQHSRHPIGPPGHDVLYDTERPPPTHHSLEPAGHPSVRRSLTISAPDSRTAQSGRTGNAVRAVSDNYPIQSPSMNQSAGFRGNERGQPPASSLSPTASQPSGPGYVPVARLSKQDRILGITAAQRQQSGPPQQLRGNGIIGKDYYEPDHQQLGGDEPARRYSGIEAYKEPKARRTFSLRKAKDWVAGRSKEEYD